MAFGDFTVVRSTVKWILNSAGLLTSIPANTPAFEFNTDGTYRGLLVEPAGTNLALQSETFSSATWQKLGLLAFGSGSIIDATASPNGAVTADQITENTSTGLHIAFQSYNQTAGTSYTFSFYVKNSVGSRNVGIRHSNGATARRSIISLSTGAVLTTATGHTVSVQSVGTYYRVSATLTATGTAAGVVYGIEMADGTNVGYTGDGTSGILVWGAQLETGSVATSYIPTVASTQTRTADSVTLTGASSLIGATEGTLYAEIEAANVGDIYSGSSRRILAISDGTANNRVVLALFTNGRSQAIVSSGAVTGANIISTTSPVSGVRKLALAYATNDVALYTAGASDGTDTSVAIPACTDVNMAKSEATATATLQLLGWIRSVVLFPTRLPNATLAALTQ